MQILSKAVGRRKEAVAQIQITTGTGQFVINDKPAQDYLQNNSCSLMAVKSAINLCEFFCETELQQKQTNFSNLTQNPITPIEFCFNNIDTIVKVKGGGLIGQTEAIKLGVARAICNIENFNYLTVSNSAGTPSSQSKNAMKLSSDSLGEQIVQNQQQNLNFTDSFNPVNLTNLDSVNSKLNINSSLNATQSTENNIADGVFSSTEKKQKAIDQKTADCFKNDGIPLDLSKSVQMNTSYSALKKTAAEDLESELTTSLSLSDQNKEDFLPEVNMQIQNMFRKQLKTKSYLTQDSRIKERRKYGLKKARKASQYHKR